MGKARHREESNPIQLFESRKSIQKLKQLDVTLFFLKNYLEETAKHQMLTYSRQEKIYIRIYFYLEQEKSTFVVEVQRQLFSKKKKKLYLH